MKKNTFNSFVSGTVALLVVVVGIPLTTQAVFRSIDDDGTSVNKDVEDVITKAKQNFSYRHDTSRGYYSALEKWRALLNPKGEGKGVDTSTLVKPDVNDPKTWEYYLNLGKKEDEAAVHEAAVSGKAADFKELSQRDQMYMRRTVKIGYCAEGLKKYAAGFYELCLSLTGKKGTAPKGIMGDVAKLKKDRKILPNTLRNRLDMGKNSPPRRESVMPGRTTTKTAAPTE